MNSNEASAAAETANLKTLLRDSDPEFWPRLKARTLKAREFEELIFLSSWRKKAHAAKIPAPAPAPKLTRLAILGGCSLYPLRELLEHICEMQGTPLELWLGDFDNYHAEIMDDAGELYAFAPEAVMLLPSEKRCQYSGALADSRERAQAEALQTAQAILSLAHRVNEKSGAEIILANFMLPGHCDLGACCARPLSNFGGICQIPVPGRPLQPVGLPNIASQRPSPPLD
ncbi:MAG TPA: hypothetical protein VGO59_08110 [Verrucomicrobiae bacterium]